MNALNASNNKPAFPECDTANASRRTTKLVPGACAARPEDRPTRLTITGSAVHNDQSRRSKSRRTLRRSMSPLDVSIGERLVDLYGSSVQVASAVSHSARLRPLVELVTACASLTVTASHRLLVQDGSPAPPQEASGRSNCLRSTDQLWIGRLKSATATTADPSAP